MGSCFTKSVVIPCSKDGNTITKKDWKSHHPKQNKNISKLLKCREDITHALANLNLLSTKIEEQAKTFIKEYKRGKGIFALKRLRLYSNMQQDLDDQLKIVEEAIVQEDELTFAQTDEIIQKTKALVAEAEELASLSGPLKDGESLKERELRLKGLFKKHHIETSDIYHKFAEYESQVHEITLTSSTIFKQSDATTQPSSLNFLED